MSFQYGFTTTFNREDWPTVEGVTAVLSGLCRFSGQSSRVDDLPAGTLRPVSRTPVGLFEKFLLWGVPGNNTQWGNPFAAISGHWGHFY